MHTTPCQSSLQGSPPFPDHPGSFGDPSEMYNPFIAETSAAAVSARATTNAAAATATTTSARNPTPPPRRTVPPRIDRRLPRSHHPPRSARLRLDQIETAGSKPRHAMLPARSASGGARQQQSERERCVRARERVSERRGGGGEVDGSEEGDEAGWQRRRS